MLTRFTIVLSFLNGLVFLAIPHCLEARNQDRNFDDFESGIELSRIYLLEDESNQLSISEVATGSFDSKFQLVDSLSMDKIALGISGSAWWFRLHVNNRKHSSETHYLTVDFSLLEEVEVYIPDGEGNFSVKRSGIAVEEQSLPWDTRVPAFRLKDLPADGIVYLKVKSHSPILVPLLIQKEKDYFSSELTRNLFFGVFFGIIFLVICYNLILAVLTQESIYFHYLAYVFFLGMLLLNYFGFSYQYLWPGNNTWIDKVMPISILCAALTMTNFIRHFVNAKSNFPTVDRFFLFSIVTYLILIPAAFFIPTSFLFLFLAFASSILIVVMVITLIKSHQNFAPATYILIGWLFLFLGVISLIGKTFGLIPHNHFTSFAILIGAVIEVIMFSIGIGYRFRWFKREAKRMAKELEEKHTEIELLRDQIANSIMDSSPKVSQLPITISKEDINSYLLNELTERELEVLYRVAEGLANREIGEQLFISTNTVRSHMRNIYDKLHVKNRTEAVFKANQLQLITT